MTNVAYLLLLAGVCLGGYSPNEDGKMTFRLQVLHTNDLHAYIDETDGRTGACTDQLRAQKKCYGGFARISQAIKDANTKAERDNIPSISLNAGDNFQGTAYYTVFKWEPIAQFIDKLGIDVMALGNHEFDDGIENLKEFLQNITTPVVCANIDIKSEPRLNLRILTSSFILTREGVDIGVVGYLTPDTTKTSATENLKIDKEISRIREEAQDLKRAGVKIIIALGHSGFPMDVKIAEEVEEVSLVVGAHSHSLLYSPIDAAPTKDPVKSEYPTWVVQPSKKRVAVGQDYELPEKPPKRVPVVQAYAFSKFLGELRVEFDEDGNVVTATGNPKLLDHTVAKDPELEKEISEWREKVKKEVDVVKGHARTYMGRAKFGEGKLQSNLGNLITDALVDFGVQYTRDLEESIRKSEQSAEPGQQSTSQDDQPAQEGDELTPEADQSAEPRQDSTLKGDQFVERGQESIPKPPMPDQGTEDVKKSTWTKAAIAFYQSGGIRSKIDKMGSGGAITLEDLMKVLPHQNLLTEIGLLGSTIREAMELSVKCYDNVKHTVDRCHFLHFSGLRIAYDFTKPIGNRIKSIETLCIECIIPKYEPLDNDRIYHVITSTFLAKGTDGFIMFKDKQIDSTLLGRTTDLSALVRYVEKNKIVYPFEDDRVTVTGFDLSKVADKSGPGTNTPENPPTDVNAK